MEKEKVVEVENPVADEPIASEGGTEVLITPMPEIDPTVKAVVSEPPVRVNPIITKPAVSEPVVKKTVVRPVVDKHFGKVYAVQIKGGNVVATRLTHEQAVAKITALEEYDKSFKGKNWTKGFYKIIPEQV